MLNMIITFLVLAIVAGLLGFTGVEIVSVEIARMLFFIFIILLALSVIMNFLRGKRPPMN